MRRMFSKNQIKQIVQDGINNNSILQRDLLGFNGSALFNQLYLEDRDFGIIFPFFVIPCPVPHLSSASLIIGALTGALQKDTTFICNVIDRNGGTASLEVVTYNKTDDKFYSDSISSGMALSPSVIKYATGIASWRGVPTSSFEVGSLE